MVDDYDEYWFLLDDEDDKLRGGGGEEGGGGEKGSPLFRIFTAILFKPIKFFVSLALSSGENKRVDDSLLVHAA